ncbi:MAG: radical SAM family heme chaperone HemW, partial [Solobacterium sp.]|nr:radical SAM family heme chaperone HemW [Solobacterium sp.]
MMTTKPKHLYLHVPFCRTICSYCDFCHVGYQETVANQWLDAIKTDIQNRHINENLRTIYIGGGTPTTLSSSQLDQLLCLLDPYAHMVQEYTIEINPETFDEDKAKMLQKHGVNRASIGFQTSDERLLQMMNRHHRLEDVAETMRLLRKYGIDNISLDLMYSLPTQTMESLKKSLQDAIALEPTHLSLYSLTIEPNTVFAKKGYEHLEDDMEADMYEWICKMLPRYGFVQYEISNFAKAGMISQHNCAYWN